MTMEHDRTERKTGKFQACISCLHCHLFHQEKHDNRYYCQPPGKPPLFLSQPHIRNHEPCEDFVLFRDAATPVVSRLCHHLLKSLLKRNGNAEESELWFTVNISHDLHVQLDTILGEIVQWEKNLTKTETELSIKFYFELARHALMRIIHLENT